MILPVFCRGDRLVALPGNATECDQPVANTIDRNDSMGFQSTLDELE
jgi:hypothetical protein